MKQVPGYPSLNNNDWPSSQGQTQQQPQFNSATGIQSFEPTQIQYQSTGDFNQSMPGGMSASNNAENQEQPQPIQVSQPLKGVSKPLELICSCSVVITKVEEMHEHLNQCLKLKMPFGQIYQTLGNYHTKCLQMPQGDQQRFAKNLKAMLTMFIDDLEASVGLDTVEIEPPVEQVKVQVQVDQSGDAEMANVVDPQEESKDGNQLSKSELMQLSLLESGNEDAKNNVIAEDQMRLLEQIQSQSKIQLERQSSSLCGWCFQEIAQGEEHVLLQTTECFHSVHVKCLQKEARIAGLNGRPCTCPACHAVIQDVEINNYMTKQDKEDIEAKQLREMMLINKNLRKCPCGAIMEVNQGDINLDQKDAAGQPISHSAAIHMSMHRVRCIECNNNFCSECQEQPYHIGTTCEEFKHHKESLNCVYCDEEIKDHNQGQRFDVCNKEECSKLLQVACVKKHDCGHQCSGFKDEKECLPCLKEECAAKAQAEESKEEAKDGKPQKLLDGINADEYCSICYVQGLGAQPCVRLGCGHVFHLMCVQSQLEKKWVTPRITFSYINCQLCKQLMDVSHCPPLQKLFEEAKQVQKVVEEKAAERAKYEELDKNPRLKDPNDHYFNKLGEFALFKLSYYQCYKCKNPYYGGMRDCAGGENQLQDFKPEELVCPKCSAASVGAGVKNCERHGAENIDFKCRYCCSVALWFCHGNTHYCDPCHRRAGRNDKKACPGGNKKEGCPLKIDHPPSGEEFALGCGLCRSALINAKEF